MGNTGQRQHDNRSYPARQQGHDTVNTGRQQVHNVVSIDRQLGPNTSNTGQRQLINEGPRAGQQDLIRLNDGEQQVRNIGNMNRQLGPNTANVGQRQRINERNPAGQQVHNTVKIGQVRNIGNVEGQQDGDRQRQNTRGNDRQHRQNNSQQRNNGGNNFRQQRINTGNNNQPSQNVTNNENWGRDHQRNQTPSQHNKTVSFKVLEEIANSDPSEIFTRLSYSQNSFINLLQTSITKLDFFPLIMKIVSKMAKSHYDQLKLKVILEVCNSNFVAHLQKYLMDLPYTRIKAQNRLYWDNQDEFWSDFVTFCDCIVSLSPSTALQKCRSLIDATSRFCLDALNKEHSFTASANYDLQLQQIRDRLIVVENEEEEKKEQRGRLPINVDEESPPPDCFRQLSVIPGREDLILEQRPYLRRNIVSGGYEDVEHYLDVQFRLLREDCFGPLRKGIREYLNNPNKKRYENIRIFRGVQFIDAYISKEKVGSLIQLGKRDVERFKKIPWDHNKRLIFGSLLLLTKDNFNTFITVRVLDRDTKLLVKGKIPITIVDNTNAESGIYNKDEYTMVESEIYFEPYLHVMRALQDPKLPDQLPMQQYIVHVNMESKHPAYLTEQTNFKVLNHKFRVLDNVWPSARELGMDESQHRAFHLALTHECAVVQGPPGTGKTFIGVQIAKTLLQNLNTSGPLILLICYTNHALDQFLKAIMQITPSVARIGGQSKDKDLDMVNLNNLRKGHSQKTPLFWENKHSLNSAIRSVKSLQNDIDLINNGVLDYKCVARFPEARLIEKQYKGKEDPVLFWLFDNVSQLVNDADLIEEIQNTPDIEQHVENYAERDDLVLDDFDIEDVENNDIVLVFSQSETEKKVKSLKHLLLQHQTVDPMHHNIPEIQREIRNMMCKLKLFKEMKANQPRIKKTSVLNERTNVFEIPIHQRWAFYLKWERVILKELDNKMKPLKDSLIAAQGSYEEARIVADASVLKTRQVIGITTSGAARLKKLLMSLATPIVIVEEAAEVLEQHIISSLTRHCQHLILIGDHQQLRPSASSMFLARHYDIEVSLFERLIMNDVHSCRLSVQHRMRPHLAELISPHIYPDLQNHPSVENFPNVRGLTSNLFFFTHDFKEAEVDDSSSRSNPQEADMVLGLANYIMQQDYSPEDVTILTAYAGQLFYMRKKRPQYLFLSKVKITVVDNYQGEESKIILLSLVRNNNADKIGFLGTPNRICVALSRAREGFYIFGNIDILKKNSQLWTGIAGTLEKRQSLGTSLVLRCEVHSSQLTEVSKLEHFNNVPEGGCLQKCNFTLPCGHDCPLVCHGYDRNHQNFKCTAKCSRILCQFDHECPLQCGVPCKPCVVLVDKLFRKCGHTNKVPCYKYDDAQLQCKTIVTKELPCKHEAKASCYMAPSAVECPVACDARLSCGHVCRSKCHVWNDPDHEQYKCQAKCARANSGCSAPEDAGGQHQCQLLCYVPCQPCTVEITKKYTKCTHKQKVKCHEDVDTFPCKKKCSRSLPCGHFCKKKCDEPCGDCKQLVKKAIPECGHEIRTTCDKLLTRKDCKSACARRLACGHLCSGPCSAECDPASCSHPVVDSYPAPCGHQVNLPCNVLRQVQQGGAAWERALLRACAARCGAQLSCGHECAGSCGGCAQGRLHRACARPCGNTNICGHICKEPCKEICPPCSQPCEVKCPHSRCTKLCGQPCVPCKEPCARRCPHGACSRRCGEPCSREACPAPCARALSCGHACRGLCGEPCPPACRPCRPDDFPTDFLGDPFDDDDKFILLQDCGHIMELENMKNLMLGDPENIKIRDCPFCRKPIINTYRYKDIVNEMFKKEINPIKQKVYGTVKDIMNRKLELSKKVNSFPDKYDAILHDNHRLVMALEKLDNKIKNKKKVNLLQVEMGIVYFNILEMMAECCQNYSETRFMSEILRNNFKDLVTMLCEAIENNINKISTQMQNDIGNEIKRLNAMVQLAKIFSRPEYSSLKRKVEKEEKEAINQVLTWKKFDESSAFRALDKLQNEIKVRGLVTKQERELIVKAIGLKAGHWFKCPNGHFYCIGECGGAMQTSKCPECGAAIGGSQHRLLADNAHAREMDGSDYPAWSELANNMANFRL